MFMEDQDNQNEDGMEGSDSSSVNNDVKPETHFADEKGVPFYNRFREVSEKLEKYKDVDLELYEKAKGLDFNEVEDALNFKSEIYKDKAKLAKVLEVLKGQQADDRAKGRESSPELQSVIQELNALKSQLQARDQGEWMKQFDDSVERTISDSLKDEAFKDLGGKLSDFEKKAVLKMVDDAYQNDQAKGRAAKLSLKDIPSITQGFIKMVLENRKASAGGFIKRDNSPQPIKGDGSSGKQKEKPLSDEQRIESMKNYMKEVEAGRVPA